MKITPRRLAAALLTCIALTAALPSGAQAAPTAAASTLTLTRTTNPQPGGGGVKSSTQLTCDPAAGAHPHAAQACALLSTVNGNYRKLKPAQDAICTPDYAPVRIQLTGTWQGQSVSYSDTVANSCEVVRWTGVIFQF